MKGFSSSSTGALESVKEQVSSSLVKVKSIFRYIPVVGRLFRKSLKNLPLQIGRATHIIITSLSYPGQRRIDDDSSMELHGTKHDFVLLLRHFDYRHENNPIEFTLLNDFEVDFTDSTGLQKVIPCADTSRDSIRRTIQGIMRSAEPDDKIAFFFGGHGGHAEVDMMGNPSGADASPDSDFQCIIAGDGRRIYGKELRSWFCEARHPSVAVTTVFDTCCSGGSLGLPYTYEVKGKVTRSHKVAGEKVPIPMVQISAAGPYGVSYSKRFEDGYCGQLTYSLLRYLKGTEYPTMEGLVAHLDENCDPGGDQKPQVCSSRKIKGLFSPF